MRPPSPFEHPTLRPDLPAYPVHLQLVYVTSSTITGPGGLLLYESVTQQLRTDTLVPRDREDCLVTDVNGVGLLPGYYLGRLAGSYNNLPVYEVSAAESTGFPLPGVTPEQWDYIVTNLTQEQIDNMVNLTSCQIQILLTTLDVTELQLVTTNYGPQQLQNLTLTTPTTGQTSTLQLITDITTADLQLLTTALTNEQITNLVTTIPITDIEKMVTDTLTYDLINELVTTLPTPQLYNLLTTVTNTELTDLVTDLPIQTNLYTLTNVPTGKLDDLVTDLNTTHITELTTALTAEQITGLMDILTTTQIIDLVDNLTTVNITTLVSVLTPDQILNLITALTTTQIEGVVTDLSITQLITLSQLPIDLITSVVTDLTMLELIALLTDVPNFINLQRLLQAIPIADIPGLITDLTAAQLLVLTGYPIATITALYNALTTADLESLLDSATTAPTPALGDQNNYPAIPVLGSAPVSAPLDMTDYAQIVATDDGNLYTYAGGQWNQIGGGGGRTEETLAATGNAQGNAAQITADAVRVTGADDTKGVILPNTTAAIIVVWNDAAVTEELKVYPPSGAQFASGSTNTPIVMNGGDILWFVRITSTVWTDGDLRGFP